jgi:hypothetical protein
MTLWPSVKQGRWGMLGGATPSKMAFIGSLQGENAMINNPLSLSREGLTALSDSELAQKIKESLDTLGRMKERGEDISVQEKVYETYVDEYNHRSKNDAPTKPHGLKAVK